MLRQFCRLAYSISADLEPSLSGYVFSLYQFSEPLSKGTWCNSDNPYYFSAYATTTLTLHANDDPGVYATDVFLVFSDVNAMIHVYKSDQLDFAYEYAPVGLKCTIVAVGTKNGKVYSSFTPITIGENDQVDFTLSTTTTDEFKDKLKALDE